ncbi:MAG: hypothetical protein HY039_03660 [Nitrospirae bacterium]|nr:hypothetical protein [Nitrospirota bacterium]
MKQARRCVRDADLAKAGAALKRAAVRARMLAEQTNTPLVIYEDGHLIRKRVAQAKAR